VLMIGRVYWNGYWGSGRWVWTVWVVWGVVVLWCCVVGWWRGVLRGCCVVVVCLGVGRCCVRRRRLGYGWQGYGG